MRYFHQVNGCQTTDADGVAGLKAQLGQLSVPKNNPLDPVYCPERNQFAQDKLTIQML